MVERVIPAPDLVDPSYAEFTSMGMGHNYWLRHLDKTVRGYRSVDPTPYLEKADAALR